MKNNYPILFLYFKYHHYNSHPCVIPFQNQYDHETIFHCVGLFWPYEGHETFFCSGKKNWPRNDHGTDHHCLGFHEK